MKLFYLNVEKSFTNGDIKQTKNEFVVIRIKKSCLFRENFLLFAVCAMFATLWLEFIVF
jgi:hypothetical protein